MSDVIYNNEGSTSLSVDQEYAGLAAQLQNKCISISTHCLQKVPDDAEGWFVTTITCYNFGQIYPGKQ